MANPTPERFAEVSACSEQKRGNNHKCLLHKLVIAAMVTRRVFSTMYYCTTMLSLSHWYIGVSQLDQDLMLTLGQRNQNPIVTHSL